MGPAPSVPGLPSCPRPLAEPWGWPHSVAQRARHNPCSCSAGRPQEKGLSAARAGSPARSAASLRRSEGRTRLGPYPRLPLLQETRSRAGGARPRDLLDSVGRHRSSFRVRVLRSRGEALLAGAPLVVPSLRSGLRLLQLRLPPAGGGGRETLIGRGISASVRTCHLSPAQPGRGLCAQRAGICRCW